MKREKIVLCVLDGLGVREESVGNVVKMAKTPNLDYLMDKYPNTLLDASGEEVGLPKGQMGNSEVGHLNIGAGRIVYQSLTLINHDIKGGGFFKNKQFLKAFDHVKKHDSTLHLFSLLSDGGVHSHIDHLLNMIDLVSEHNIKNLYLHLFLDGRDVLPQSAKGYLEQLNNKINETGVGVIASISGRYYAMDRDNNLDRTLKAYDNMVNLKGNTFSDPFVYLEKEYIRLRNVAWEVSDEFVCPGHSEFLTKGIEDNDAIIFLNFRPDRAIQLSTLITNKNFYKEKAKVKQLENIFFVSMMKYSNSVKAEVAYKLDLPDEVLGEVLAKRRYHQLRIAETEKYAHVTYFLDGMKKYDGVELPSLKNATRILIDSPKVSTYDLKPEMSAYTICDTLVNEISKNIYDVIIVNFANCDMVGHTAIEKACIRALEVVDECVGELYKSCKSNDYTLIITADHGNIEKIVDEFGKPFSAHTTSKVPFIVTKSDVYLKPGILADIAPSILYLLDEKIPAKMEGKNLISKKGEN